MALSKEREGRLTASSHSIPLGHGFKSPQAYWREWNGMEEHDEQTLARFAYGHEHEVDALHAYEEITGDIVTHCLDRQEFIKWEDWSGCTPDGRTALGVVELKCPNKIPETPSVGYWIQVQSQLVMTDEGVADLCMWTPEGVGIWRTKRASDYWPTVEPILRAYHGCLTAGMEPKRGQFKKIQFDHQWTRIA